jgi:hypothetical protein
MRLCRRPWKALSKNLDLQTRPLNHATLGDETVPPKSGSGACNVAARH